MITYYMIAIARRLSAKEKIILVEVIEKTVVCFSVLLLKLVTSLARETITSTTAITISPVKQVTIWALITLKISYTQ